MVIMSEQSDIPLVVDDCSDEDEDAQVDVTTNDDDHHAQDLRTRLGSSNNSNSSIPATPAVSRAPTSGGNKFHSVADLASSDAPDALHDRARLAHQPLTTRFFPGYPPRSFSPFHAHRQPVPLAAPSSACSPRLEYSRASGMLGGEGHIPVFTRDLTEGRSRDWTSPADGSTEGSARDLRGSSPVQSTFPGNTEDVKIVDKDASSSSLLYNSEHLTRELESGSRSPGSRSFRGHSVPSPTLSVEDGEAGSARMSRSPPGSPRASSPLTPGTPSDGGIRRYRTAFSKDQITLLEKEFAKENYISRPKRCELAAAMGLPESTIKVWFQNRRMKDKRQRLALTWPYGIPPDPHLYAYIAAATASFPYPLSLPGPAPPFSLPAPPHALRSLSSLQAHADMLTARSELMTPADAFQSRMTSELLSPSRREPLCGPRAELLGGMTGGAFHKPGPPPHAPGMLDVRPSLASYPLGLGLAPVSALTTFADLSGLGAGAGAGPIGLGSKACLCPALPTVHSLAAHLPRPPHPPSPPLSHKPEVTLS